MFISQVIRYQLFVMHVSCLILPFGIHRQHAKPSLEQLWAAHKGSRPNCLILMHRLGCCTGFPTCSFFRASLPFHAFSISNTTNHVLQVELNLVGHPALLLCQLMMLEWWPTFHREAIFHLFYRWALCNATSSVHCRHTWATVQNLLVQLILIIIIQAPSHTAHLLWNRTLCGGVQFEIFLIHE